MWTIENRKIRVTVECADGKVRLRSQGELGMDFALHNLGQLGVSCQSACWTTCESAQTDGSVLALSLLSADGALRLSLRLETFEEGFLRISGQADNLGAEAIHIRECHLLDLRPDCPPPVSLFHVEQFSAQYQRNFFRPVEARLIVGRAAQEIRMGSYPSQYWQPTSCAWFAMLPEREGSWFEAPAASGDGLVCGVEFNGKSTLRAQADEGGSTVQISVDALNHRLAPGDAFELPAVFLGRFKGDWDEAGYVTQRFTEARVSPPMPDARYPWAQYNSWAYDQNIDEAQQMAAIERCAELGLELAVLDLGWARCIGDWRPDPVKFPRGLKPLSDRAHALGMRFGVHIALAQCSLNAPAAKEHPEWLTREATDYFGAAALCLGHAPCREWLVGQISDLIEREGVDYLIQDGEDMVKHCTRADHTHAPGDANYACSQYGLDRVILALRARHPELVVENCEDGGCMMTYRMVRLYHTSITVDNIDAYSTRQGVFGASYPFSPRYSVRYMQDAPEKYTLYSSIFLGPLILMHRVTEWNERQMAETRAAVALYKRIREITREAKIIHLKRPDGWGWDAIQALGRERSVVMVYRTRGGEPTMRVCPRGLECGAVYRVCAADGTPLAEADGAALAQTGVELALKEMDAEALFIECAGRK